MNTEIKLRRTASIQTTLEALRESLREGTLGKHLPRMFAQRVAVADAVPKQLNTITLAGVKNGMALIEIRSVPGALRPLHTITDANEWRRRVIAEQFDGTPWLRALVPLGDTLMGAAVQLRQPHAFTPYDIGFIYDKGGSRRGVASRHFTHWHVACGAADFRAPSVKLYCGEKADKEAYFAVPVDSYLNIRFGPTGHGPAPAPIAQGPLLRTTLKLSADRAARKQMRESALDVLNRVTTAMAMLDIPQKSTGCTPVAMALQDLLGMTNTHPDYDFRLECESAMGRDFRQDDPSESLYAAGVLIGAVHTGSRSELFDDYSAQCFLRVARKLDYLLRKYEDRVFQANTIFSATPELTGDPQIMPALLSTPNLTAI